MTVAFQHFVISYFWAEDWVLIFDLLAWLAFGPGVSFSVSHCQERWKCNRYLSAMVFCLKELRLSFESIQVSTHAFPSLRGKWGLVWWWWPGFTFETKVNLFGASELFWNRNFRMERARRIDWFSTISIHLLILSVISHHEDRSWTLYLEMKQCINALLEGRDWIEIINHKR